LDNEQNINELIMTNTIGHSKTVNSSEIASVAYSMWEAAGKPASRDLQFWLDAEAQLVAAKALADAPASPVSTIDSKNNGAEKVAKMRFGFPQAASKPQHKVRRF
jgi:hypothetical protein